MAVATPQPNSTFQRPIHGPAIAAEAPDSGIWAAEAEAPETRRGREPEAPDAGDGRVRYLETEFTHGRSQS